MPMGYNNVAAPHYSEAQRTWTSPQDWTVNGVDTLVLYIRGLATNSPVLLYVALQDSAGHLGVATHADRAAATSVEWITWPIPMSQFTAQGVTASGITKMHIGADDRGTGIGGGIGSLVIDDIRVIRSTP
jgi:hypothetical protein